RSREAVDARVHAAPVRVDRPVEREVAARHAIDDGLRLDLDALDPPELRGVERPPGELEELLFGHGWDTIEQVFESRQSPSRGTRANIERWRRSWPRPGKGSTPSGAHRRVSSSPTGPSPSWRRPGPRCGRSST